MNIITIDWKMLNNISYRSKLGRSLKNTLRKFDKEELFEELFQMIEYFTEVATEDKISHENRIKSIQSCQIKYEKYFPSGPVEKVFNDILGIRIIVDNYDTVRSLHIPDESIRFVDMSNGKSNDDGYRAIHMYFQKDHNHYPIEIQFMTPFDRQFNEWLHIYLYKYVEDDKIGMQLRQMYEFGLIKTEEKFRKEVQNVLSSSQEVQPTRLHRR